jgi:teichuronic acid biosynthesis glycosyltransferase TuaG
VTKDNARNVSTHVQFLKSFKRMLTMKENKTNCPIVSVITPSYNSSRFILETIKSVQTQTYSSWEMVIVDDCSVDGSQQIILNEAKKDNRIKFISLLENEGAAVARNTAIKASSGKYIAFLDSDDLWLPHKLELQISFMEQRDIAFSFTKYGIIEEDGIETKTVINIPDKVDYKYLLKNTIIGCLTVILDKEKLGMVQMPNIRSRQDTALWLLILKKGYIAHGLQEELAKYRKVKGSISSNKIKAAKQTWSMYRKVEQLSFLYSVWCFINYAWNATAKIMKKT